MLSLLKIPAILFFDLIDFIHRKRILKFLNKIKKNINIFFDVGAHKGKYTDLIINNYQVKKAFLFEPQENCYNFILEKYKNKNYIKTFNSIVSNSEIKKEILINKHDLTSSLTEINFDNSYLKFKAKLFGTNLTGMVVKKTLVKSLQLEKLILDNLIEKIDLIKIDTEGHEYEVLQGIGKSIKKIDIILIEFHKDDIYLNYNSDKIHNHLLENNFLLKKIFKFPFTKWEDRIYIKSQKGN